MTEQQAEKTATFKEESVANGYFSFTMTYPSGKTYTQYLAPENYLSQAHDLINRMCACFGVIDITDRILGI